MKEIKFTDLNVDKFLVYLNKADVKEIQILEFTKKLLICKGFPPGKTFVKYTVIDIDEILKFPELPVDFTLLKFPLYRLKKVINVLNVYSKAEIKTVTGSLVYEDIDGDPDKVGTHIKFVSKNMNISTKGTEMYLASYMTAEMWNHFSNREGKVVEFQMRKDFIDRVSNLCNLEGDDNTENKDKDISFILKASKDGKLIFSSKDKDKWSIEYDSVADGNLITDLDADLSVFVPKDAIDAMTSPLYDVYIINNTKVGQYVLVMFEDDYNIMLKGLMLYDPN